MLTKEYVSRLFTYRDGILHWKGTRSSRVCAGDVAGHFRKDNGRCVIRVGGKLLYAHRLIFLLHHGWLPAEIDHIDRNPANNRIENLRAVTRAQNQWNSCLRIDNTSGIKNVCWYAPTQKWAAQIRVNGKRKRLGYFNDVLSATKAIAAAQAELHGVFANFEELK